MSVVENVFVSVCAYRKRQALPLKVDRGIYKTIRRKKQDFRMLIPNELRQKSLTLALDMGDDGKN